MNTIEVGVVVTDGLIDTKATTAAFETALARRVSEVEIESSTIGEAITAVFAKDPVGTFITMPILTSLTLSHMQVPSTNYAVIETRVKDFVRANSNGDNSTYVIVKGAHGGVGIRANYSPKAKKTSAK